MHSPKILDIFLAILSIWPARVSSFAQQGVSNGSIISRVSSASRSPAEPRVVSKDRVPEYRVPLTSSVFGNPIASPASKPRLFTTSTGDIVLTTPFPLTSLPSIDFRSSATSTLKTVYGRAPLEAPRRSESLVSKFDDCDSEDESCDQSVHSLSNGDSLLRNLTQLFDRALSNDDHDGESFAEDILANSIKRLHKRVLSQPWQYSQFKQFFEAQIFPARLTPHGRKLSLKPPSEQGSARLEKFRDTPFTMGVVNLFGCTAVIVISEKAGRIGHYWEPSIGKTNVDGSGSEERFQEEVISPLKKGGEFWSVHSNKMWEDEGLEEHARGLFSPDSNPTVFLITPSRMDGRVLNANNNDRIEEALREVFPALSPIRINYVKRSDDPFVTDPEKVERINNAKGKFVIRYDPGSMEAEGGPQVASADIWFEETRTPAFTTAWSPHPEQIVS